MRIAIVKLSALGDIVHAMLVLQYIKQALPDASIDWFVDARFSNILENNPDLRTIYPLRLKGQRLGLWRTLQHLKNLARQNQYDIIIDLQGLIKSAFIARVLGKHCIGFDKNSLREPLAALCYDKKFSIDYSENVILRNLKLTCQALNIALPSLHDMKPFLFSMTKALVKPDILIIVGSSWPSKVYPKEHFITVLNALHVKSFIAWGNEKEKADAEFIAHHTQATVLPALSLDELKAIVQNSALIIGGDSGPTHMAWALKRPSITIFGPTPSQRNTLQTDINKIVDAQKPIDARHLNKNDPCIQSIAPHRIIQLAKELLAC